MAGLAAVLIAATVASPVAAQQVDGLGDVPDDAFYSVPVAELAQRGVFAGTLCDEGFCPGMAIDRKTMAVWVVRLLDEKEPTAVTQTRFADIDADSFYAPFVERMAELGVTTGCGDGTNFCPDRSTTRAETAAFLSRAYDLPEGPDPDFSDVPADAWYAANVAKLAASGITKGCGDGTGFCPGRTTSRAEMATFLHRAEARNPTDQPRQLGDCIATPTSVSAAGLDRTEILDYFLEIALGVEFGSSHQVIVKWETDLEIQVHGEPTTEDRDTLGQVIAELNGIIGSPRLRLVQSSPNVDIHFVPISQFQSIVPNYVTGNWGYFSMWWSSFVILGANILIASDSTVGQEARSHLIREELTQVLGLANDSYAYADSIFYQAWTETAEYSDIDRTIIGILYRDDVAPGMDRADLQKVLNLPFCPSAGTGE